MRRWAALWVMSAVVVVWMPGASPAASEARHIVLLFDERPELPGMAALDAGFTGTLKSSFQGPVEIYREAMDLSRFDSQSYRMLLQNSLRAKYSDKRIDAVVAIMAPTLDFLLSHGDSIFPGTPIVFCGVDSKELGGRSLPPHVSGILVKREFAPTLEVALGLHPETRHVVVVAGTSEFDAGLLAQAKEEFRIHEGRLAFRYLTSLPLRKLLMELSQLPLRTIVLFTTLFRDGAGEPFVSHDVVERVSAAANAPVYGFLDLYLGQGIVGGNLYSLAEQGPEAARLVLRILAGAEADEAASPEPRSSKLLFDWRQLQRWGISENRLPKGSEVRFRPVTIWYQYQWLITLVALALLLQTALIGGLLYEHRRRRRVEVESRQRVAELARSNRRAVAGAMSASIAHELNQPLTAILSNAEAAHDLLSRKNYDPEKIQEILADIIDEDTRASEVIDRIRMLLKKDESKSEPIDVNELVNSTLHLLHGEQTNRSIIVETYLDPEVPDVFGDPVQLQQVLINLLVNAMDAVASKPAPERLIKISTRTGGKQVEVEILDFGHGIAAGDRQRLFDPFFTTNQTGLGLGLSICSTIVKAHDGKLTIENNQHGGATVALRFPAHHALVSA